MKLFKVFREVPEPEGQDEVLIVGPYIWGKGKTLRQAFDRVYREGLQAKDQADVYHCHHDTWVDEGGAICSPATQRPHRVARINFTHVGKLHSEYYAPKGTKS